MSARIVCSGTRPSLYISRRLISPPPRRPEHWIFTPAAPERIAEASRGLGEHGALVERLGRALAADMPLFARDGGFIAAGYSDELDEWRGLRDESRRMTAALQARYADETAIAALKIRHNNVIG